MPEDTSFVHLITCGGDLKHVLLLPALKAVVH
jgi:hypothetical protein